MILEGLVTTIAEDGSLHLAPMGPRVAEDFSSFVLRPFPTSTTYKNLCRHPEGVLHITDDVLLLAKAALGKVNPMPAHRPADHVRGFVLTDACRYFEFRIHDQDRSEARIRLEATVVGSGRLRDFFGFNRAKHAVLEAAILATRFHLLDIATIQSEFERLRTIVDKTAGPSELEAMCFLEEQWQNYRQEMVR